MMSLHLNHLKPAKGSHKKSRRVGRGIGSGRGKTCGKGHKGQHARAGGYHKLGFEGGQMPLQRRLPKFGFVSRNKSLRHEIRLSELDKLFQVGETVSLATLKQKNMIHANIKLIKIIDSGHLKKSLIISKKMALTASSRQKILACGGKIETDN